MAERELPSREISSLDNSYASRENKKAPSHVTPILDERDVILPKKPFGDRLKGMIFSRDVGEMFEDFFRNNIVPGFLNGILEFLAMCFFGASSPRSGYTNYSRGGRYVDNPSYYRSRYPERYSKDDRRDSGRGRVDYQTIVIRSEEKAKRVVREIRGIITDCGQASVANLLEACGYDYDWTDTDVGWVDEQDIGLEMVRDGFLIDVRRATSLR